MVEDGLYELRKEFRFEAAHRLPEAGPAHKCSRLHGHSFRVRLVVRGRLDPAKAWIVDAADVKEAFLPTLKLLDHHYLNEVPGLESPTAEVLASWIYRRVKERLPALAQVVVAETCTMEAAYPA